MNRSIVINALLIGVVSGALSAWNQRFLVRERDDAQFQYTWEHQENDRLRGEVDQYQRKGNFFKGAMLRHVTLHHGLTVQVEHGFVVFDGQEGHHTAAAIDLGDSRIIVEGSVIGQTHYKLPTITTGPGVEHFGVMNNHFTTNCWIYRADDIIATAGGPSDQLRKSGYFCKEGR